MAGHRELTTTTQRKAVDGSKRWLGVMRQAIEDRVAEGGKRLALCGGVGAEFGDVSASRESFLTRARQQNRLHAGVTSDVSEMLAKLGDERFMECVELGGVVDGEGGDAVGVGAEDVFGGGGHEGETMSGGYWKCEVE